VGSNGEDGRGLIRGVLEELREANGEGTRCVVGVRGGKIEQSAKGARAVSSASRRQATQHAASHVLAWSRE
jgi:hypothetical protein